MVLKEDLRGRRRLLRKLGHTDRDFSILLPKGQVQTNPSLLPLSA